MGKLVLTCVLALVFGFGGAAGAVAAFHGQLLGPPGATGLTGPPGATGPGGSDGASGEPGARGLPGRAGTAGKAGSAGKSGAAAAKAPVAATDLGTGGCAGASVQVLTRASITAQQQLVVVAKRICVVRPSATP